MSDRITATRDKALQLNLDSSKYGTFAEIGAGQETAAWFFRVGGASGTIAKTISAYDMTMSDAIYGTGPRYVSRERLTDMLAHEYEILTSRLAAKRGAGTQFFSFCNTVRARAYSDKGVAECHGWLGIRLQITPMGAPNDILLHVRMLDDTNLEQQRALGTIGVNLIWAALKLRHSLKDFIESLTDELRTGGLEVDMLKFEGPDFVHIDNREVALQLVESGLTDAAFFTAEGEIMQVSEKLYKRSVLVLRGSFNPVTLVHMDMLKNAREGFRDRLRNPDEPIVELMEFSINNAFGPCASCDHADFLRRATALQKLGENVLISRFGAFHRLGTYLSRYTQEPVGLILSVDVLERLFDEKYYDDLPGGILENFGRLFKHQLRLYVYPILDRETGQMRTAAKAQIPDNYSSLFDHLTVNDRIQSIANGARQDLLRYWTTEIRDLMEAGDPSWKSLVPPGVAEIYEAAAPEV